MWQSIISAGIIVVCAFFLGRRLFRQLTGRHSGCGGSCKGCNDKTADTTTCNANSDFPRKSES